MTREEYVVCEDEEEHYFDESGEEVFYHDFKPETLARFREAVGQLRRAAIFAKYIDWLLSIDDSEDSFLIRIEKELAALDSNNQKQCTTSQTIKIRTSNQSHSHISIPLKKKQNKYIIIINVIWQKYKKNRL